LKSLAILLIFVMFVMFVPITIYGQGNADTIIIIEPAPDSKNVLVTIEGELNNEGKVILYIKGIFGNSVGGYAQEYIFTENNPTHVFELDYTFLPNEVYTATAVNGPNNKLLEWVPIPATQEKSTTKQDSSKSVQTIEDVPNTFKLEEPVIGQTTFDSDLVQSLGDENKMLREEIVKKNAVIMEQIKVIQGLASQISNAIFSNTNDSTIHLIALEEQTTIDELNSAQSLRDENKMLREEIVKKDAVIMEQIKVIQDLASQISNAIFSNTNDSTLHLIALEEQTTLDELNSAQSLRDENKILREEIVKKDAVIMEQIKVIQDLASQLKNTIFEITFNYLSLV